VSLAPWRTTITARSLSEEAPGAGRAPDHGGGGRRIEVNGATLYFEEHGAGTPLVLIHSGLASSAM
jgi:hypothetical protein